MRFNVVMTVTIWVTVSCNVIPCSLVESYQHAERTAASMRVAWRQQVSLKSWQLSHRLCCVTSQDNNL
jgi:hypothetical protein